MVQFRVWSDLHLESGTWREEWFENATGQYLILAGDIIEMRKIPANIEFFRRCSEAFVKVFYIAGNHEHWGAYIEKWPWVQKILEEAGLTNIHCLQQDSFQINDDLTIFGATMWYNASHLTNGMPRAMLKQEAKDYKYISTNRRISWSGLRAADVVQMNAQHINWLKRELAACTTRAIVVTHHAPHELSKDPNWDDDHKEYVNDLDLDEFPALAWIHGHVHYSHFYHVGADHAPVVICNPRGYEAYQAVNATFDPQLTLTIDENGVVW